MSSCCSSPVHQANVPGTCPRSGTKGIAVDPLTVKALLTETALRRFAASTHHFCPEPACDVVYFDDGGGVYLRADVRVPVWQKEPFGSRVVCYCFGEDERYMRAEILTTGRSEAVERVRDHIAAGRCACEVRNPRGVCCLGDVTAAVKQVTSALQSQVPAVQR